MPDTPGPRAPPSSTTPRRPHPSAISPALRWGPAGASRSRSPHDRPLAPEPSAGCEAAPPAREARGRGQAAPYHRLGFLGGESRRRGPDGRSGGPGGHAPTPAAARKVVAPQWCGPAYCPGAPESGRPPAVSARDPGRAVGEGWAPGVLGVRGACPWRGRRALRAGRRPRLSRRPLGRRDSHRALPWVVFPCTWPLRPLLGLDLSAAWGRSAAFERFPRGASEGPGAPVLAPPSLSFPICTGGGTGGSDPAGADHPWVKGPRP